MAPFYLNPCIFQVNKNIGSVPTTWHRTGQPWKTAEPRVYSCGVCHLMEGSTEKHSRKREKWKSNMYHALQSLRPVSSFFTHLPSVFQWWSNPGLRKICHDWFLTLWWTHADPFQHPPKPTSSPLRAACWFTTRFWSSPPGTDWGSTSPSEFGSANWKVIDSQPMEPNIALSYPYFSIIKDRLYWVMNDTETKEETAQTTTRKCFSYGWAFRFKDWTISWPISFGQASMAMLASGVQPVTKMSTVESARHPKSIIAPPAITQGPLWKNWYGPLWALIECDFALNVSITNWCDHSSCCLTSTWNAQAQTQIRKTWPEG